MITQPNGHNFTTVLVPARIRRLVIHSLWILAALLVLSSTARAQIYTPYSGSLEDWVAENNYTWIRTTAMIEVGTYVEDLISDVRWNQPEGRGRLGIVTGVNWDANYHTMAATVDFWRDYSVGIVFPELSAIELIAVPEPAGLLIFLPGALLLRAWWNRRAGL